MNQVLVIFGHYFRFGISQSLAAEERSSWKYSGSNDRGKCFYFPYERGILQINYLDYLHLVDVIDNWIDKEFASGSSL